MYEPLKFFSYVGVAFIIPGVVLSLRYLYFRQILDELRREGLEAVQTLGQPFDPEIHEAVATEEHTELPHHTIMEELQRGYTLHQRLLRPALVKVSTHPGGSESDSFGNEA